MSNRWYDKPIQYIVCDNGTSGFVGEHSMMDGMTTGRLNQHVLQSIAEHEPEPESSHPIAINSDDQPSKPELLRFNVPMPLSSQIYQAQTHLLNLSHSLQANVIKFQDYGSTFMRERQYSATAYVHMIIQLASYRFHGKSVSTSDYVSTSKFNRGRLEIVRVASSEAREFCSAMSARVVEREQNDDNAAVNGILKRSDDDSENKNTCLEFFDKAIKRHVSRVCSAVSGQGIDTHLLALRKMVRTEEEEQIPAFFHDQAYSTSMRNVVCTTSFGSPVGEAGFSPEVEGGFAVSFAVEESRYVPPPPLLFL